MISLGDSTFPQQMRMTREEKDEIAEILHILSEKPQQFRLQFMGVPSPANSNMQDEKTIWVPDAPTAVRLAVDAPLPADALGVRVIDQKGCTVFERQKGVTSLDGSQVARLSRPSAARRTER
jgi:hypothetical protein